MTPTFRSLPGYDLTDPIFDRAVDYLYVRPTNPTCGAIELQEFVFKCVAIPGLEAYVRQNMASNPEHDYSPNSAVQLVICLLEFANRHEIDGYAWEIAAPRLYWGENMKLPDYILTNAAWQMTLDIKLFGTPGLPGELGNAYHKLREMIRVLHPSIVRDIDPEILYPDCYRDLPNLLSAIWKVFRTEVDILNSRQLDLQIIVNRSYDLEAN